MSERQQITRESIDVYLKELAKEYKKAGGKALPAEIILVGGASILVNYGFRNMTTDVDAIIFAASMMKDAASKVGDKYNLPVGWFNSDVLKTESYSEKLVQHSHHYKTFSGVLNIRTVKAEYLVAMKMRSGRAYKHDLSDVIGIIEAEAKKGNRISLVQIKEAVCELYGSWETVKEEVRKDVADILEEGHLEGLYEKYQKREKHVREIAIQFAENYPGVLNITNANSIIWEIQKKTS